MAGTSKSLSEASFPLAVLFCLAASGSWRRATEGLCRQACPGEQYPLGDRNCDQAVAERATPCVRGVRRRRVSAWPREHRRTPDPIFCFVHSAGSESHYRALDPTGCLTQPRLDSSPGLMACNRGHQRKAKRMESSPHRADAQWSFTASPIQPTFSFVFCSF